MPQVLDLPLSDEQQMLRDTVRDFASNVLTPQAIEIDRDARFPVDTFEQMAEMGFLGLPIPESYGGAGMNTVSFTILIEELARCCGSTALGVAAHTSLCMWPIWAFGTEEQRQRYVPDLATGKKLGAFGLTEPNAGSDAGGTRTTAARDGDEYILNGSKIFITNANYAETFVVTAMTDPSLGTRGGISSFVLERGMDGFQISKGDEKLGMRGSDWGELSFQDCRVPVAQRLGGEGEGFVHFMKTLDGGRIGIGALAMGLASGAYDRSLKYASERIAFGKPIARQQAVAFMLADMATGLAAARHLVRQAAVLKDQKRAFVQEAAMAKLFASEMAMKTTFDAIQIHGAYGFVTEYQVERMWRDAKLCTIGEGTSEIQRVVISRAILRDLS